jgi:DNA repair exonuclease SbcCD nuclease subunit
MSLSFVHMADVHLDYQQCGHPERLRDFGHAFLHASTCAAGRRADVAPISDDLFHRSKDEPPFTILMRHLGLEGEMPNVPGGLPRHSGPAAALQALKEGAHHAALAGA